MNNGWGTSILIMHFGTETMAAQPYELLRRAERVNVVAILGKLLFQHQHLW